MPEISRFLGIVIAMFYRDHSPPHFHAIYGDFEVTVTIETGIVSGEFPKRALSHVLEWLELHKSELLKDWELAKERRPLNKVNPLEWTMIARVTDARHVDKFTIWIKFNDGSEGEVDLKDELWGPVFEPLKDINRFRKFSVHPDLHTITWENGADFSPEFLHSILRATA
jgi:Domain of unknown function (DUF4160)/Protein of unknown function (DUF2442)